MVYCCCLKEVAGLRYLEGASPKESRICAFLYIILCKAFTKVKKEGRRKNIKEKAKKGRFLSKIC